MTPRERQKVIARVKESTAFLRQQAFFQMAARYFVGPLTEEEREIGREILRHVGSPNWYHGGLPGRGWGEYLLPPAETGQDPRKEGEVWGDRLRAVYFSQDIQLARKFARKVPRGQGVVYQIAPEGAIEPDAAVLRAWLMMSDDEQVNFRRESLPFVMTYFCAPRAQVIDRVE